MRQLFWFSAALIEPEQIANLGRSRNCVGDSGAIGKKTETYNRLIAPGKFGLFASRGIEGRKVCPPFFCYKLDYAAAIRRPDRRVCSTPAGRSHIPTVTSTHVRIALNAL